MYSIFPIIKYPIVSKGGEGSGHFEHTGRPGEVGGSSSSGGGDNIVERGSSEYESTFASGFSVGSEVTITSLAEGGYRTRRGESEYEIREKSAKGKVVEEREKAVKFSRMVESKGKEYTVWFPKSVMEPRSAVERGKPEYILKDKFAANMESYQEWGLKAK